ncbi:MAG: N-acetylmuramoyl-L-alanine amidase [Victivallaceae bacterium]|nr:N-acetylmuramoyl-L-alanine amidase [Victivallaceae bacterium]
MKKLFLPLLMLLAACQPEIIKIDGTSYITGRAVGKRLHLECLDKPFMLAGQEYIVSADPNERFFRLNGVKLWLAYPTVESEYGLCFSEYDFNNTLLPLFDAAPLTRRKISKIVIDPGHGGAHPGAPGKLAKEKEFNLAIAGKLAGLLRDNGFEVILTRNGDETLELPPRAAKAAESEADIFVSIHCNSAPNPDANGIETFSITPRGAANSNDNADHSLKVPPDENASGYRFTVDSFALSSAIQRRLIESTGAFDRGAKRARFHVLYNNTVPAVLVECGFMSHKADEDKLATPEYQTTLTRAIARGIADYAERTAPPAPDKVEK